MTPHSKPPQRTLSNIVIGIGVAGVAVGLFVVFYGFLLLPEEVDRGQNPLSGPLRWTQFACACGVPLPAAVAIRASLKAERGETLLARALIALALSAASFIAWVAIIVDWSAAS
jgi:hypothetical protein